MKMTLLQLLQISIMIGKHDRHTILVTVFITNHIRSTWEGNVFTRVCDSVHGEGGDRVCPVQVSNAPPPSCYVCSGGEGKRGYPNHVTQPPPPWLGGSVVGIASSC